jgi:hypothetical protein
MFTRYLLSGIHIILISFMYLACGELEEDEDFDQSDPSTNAHNSSTMNSFGGTNETQGDNNTSSNHPWVDSMCTDGQYTEMLPNMNIDISDLVNGYDPQHSVEFLVNVLERRYPIGASLVEAGVETPFGNCVEFFLNDTSSAQAIFYQISTLVHECGHFADLELADFISNLYIINQNLEITCRGGDTTDRSGSTFARSLLNNDIYALPACQGAQCDFYRDVYLDGDAFNSEFEGGDQGYNSIAEETLQYINSIAVSYAFSNELTGRSISERDGILTFLWYTLRYLRMARLEYPQAYDKIAKDSCWRELTLTLWGRAWLFLDASHGLSHLGINDTQIEARLTPELIEEIHLLRDLECR